MNYSDLIRISLIGDSLSGKSTWLVLLREGRFTEEYIQTIGIDFISIMRFIDRDFFKIQIFDTSGDAQFINITKSYIRGPKIVIIFIDLSKTNSIQSQIDRWVDTYNNNIGSFQQLMFFGTKIDIAENDSINTLVNYCNLNDFEYVLADLHHETRIIDIIYPLLEKGEFKTANFWEIQQKNKSKTNDKKKCFVN